MTDLRYPIGKFKWSGETVSPEVSLTLDEVLGIHAWHRRHHVAHITSLRQRQGW